MVLGSHLCGSKFLSLCQVSQRVHFLCQCYPNTTWRIMVNGWQSGLCFRSQAWWLQKTFLGLALVDKISICKIILCRCRSSYGHVIWAASADPATVPRCAEDPHAEYTTCDYSFFVKSPSADPATVNGHRPIQLRSDFWDCLPLYYSQISQCFGSLQRIFWTFMAFGWTWKRWLLNCLNLLPPQVCQLEQWNWFGYEADLSLTIFEKKDL